MKQNFIEQEIKLGFLGAGKMGYGILLNIYKKTKNLNVKIYRHKKGVKKFWECNDKIKESKSISNVVHDADILCTCLSDSNISMNIFMSKEFKKTLRKGTQILDFTTQSLEFSSQAGRYFKNLGCYYYDCPVIRGPSEAEKGRLVTLAGGIHENSMLWNILKCFSEKILCLPSGCGTKYKLLNNYICMSFNAVVQTALQYSEALNIDRIQVTNMMSLGSHYIQTLPLMNEYIETKNSEILNFSIRNAKKDLSYFIQMMHNSTNRCDLEIPLAIHKVFDRRGLNDFDTLPRLYFILLEEMSNG